MSRGLPFLTYCAADGGRQALELAPEFERVTIGRRANCALAVTWDGEVSRVHAELVRMGSEWVLCDDGLSHNGTFVNGVPVRGRRRLRPGDVIKVGTTLISLCAPDRSSMAPTRDARRQRPVKLTPAQRRLLEALCRPLRETGYGAPASNRELAAELVLSLDTVKGTLTSLFELFGLSALPQNQKRAILAARALGHLGEGQR